jgi:formamidopyrimidine-DNA glycosylase
MPELPEVETVCRGLREHVIDDKISDVIIRQHKLRELIPENLKDLIKNTSIIKVFRKAKYIILTLSNNSYLIIHLGMSGTFTIQSKDSVIAKHSHLDIELSSGLILRYTDPRKFGMVIWDKNYLENKYLKKCGIEPLTEEFLNDYLYKKSRNKKTAIKPFLMKNEIVVGIGNIYASESLFKSGINPERASKDLTKKEFKILSNNAQNILLSSIQSGGTTLKDHRTGLDEKGAFQNELFVYGQKDCKICKTEIKKITQAQRTTYYCPNCQK